MNNIEVVNKLIECGITFGSAESLTGGLFASSVTSVPGVSKVYKGSIVSYATQIKNTVLKIDEDITSNYGVVSSETAYEMAKNAREILDVDLAISFTGNAGPEAMENKPVGRIYLGIAYKDEIETYELNLEGNRQEIRNKCVEKAFEIINIKIFKKN